MTLPAACDLTRVVTYFCQDGTNVSFPASLRIQVQAPDGTWADASGEVPVGAALAGVPVTVSGPVAAVRVVMTARPSGYITASEIEVYAKSVPVSKR